MAILKWTLLSMIFLGFFQCKSTETPARENSNNYEIEQVTQEDFIPNADEKLILEVRKTECFGKCPTYHWRYYSTGRLEYEGEAHVEPVGHYTRNLSREEQDRLAEYIKQADLLSAIENYDPYLVDAQFIHVKYHEGEDHKKFKGAFSFPAPIKKLLRHLDSHYPLDPAWKPMASNSARE